jgi:hypothetical protein
LRRRLLKVFIGFLSISALVAILSVLSGQFGQTQLKVLASTFSITAASICAMSCAAFIERDGNRRVGGTGIAAAAIAVSLVVIGVWAEAGGEYYWKTTVTLIVVSVAFAHACLLRLPKLAESQRWMQALSTLLISLLALQIIFLIWGKFDGDGFYRLIAVVSVLVVLVTLVVPISSRLNPAAVDAPADVSLPRAVLVLRNVAPSIFEDESGRRYQVTEVEAVAGPTEATPA